MASNAARSTPPRSVTPTRETPGSRRGHPQGKALSLSPDLATKATQLGPQDNGPTVTQSDNGPVRAYPNRQVRESQRRAQKRLRRARIEFIVELMAADQWEPALIPYLGDKWCKASTKLQSREDYIRRLSAEASNLIAPCFNRDEVWRKVNVRSETIQRDGMRKGTVAAHRVVLRAAELQMKLVGLGQDTPIQPQAALSQTIQVVALHEGKERLRAPVMRALFREKPALPTKAGTPSTVVVTTGEPVGEAISTPVGEPDQGRDKR